MPAIVVLPTTFHAARCQRIVADLNEAIATGRDLGSRKQHIVQIDAELGRMLAALPAELATLPEMDPMAQAFRTKAKELVSLAETVRSLAQKLT